MAIFQNSKLLPNSKFYSKIISDNEDERNSWFRGLLNSISESDLIFFDPDTGIERDTIRIGNKNSSKYIFWSELKTVWNTGKDLLIFQYFPRVKRESYIDNLSEKVRFILPEAKCIPIQTSTVLFMLIVRKDKEKVKERIHDQLTKNWNDEMKVFG